MNDPIMEHAEQLTYENDQPEKRESIYDLWMRNHLAQVDRMIGHYRTAEFLVKFRKAEQSEVIQ